MMVLLVDEADGAFAVREDQAAELARLGVTSVAVVRDERLVGVVLEGWLFDPARSGRAAADTVAAQLRARTLHPVMHLAVSAANRGGRNVERRTST